MPIRRNLNDDIDEPELTLEPWEPGDSREDMPFHPDEELIAEIQIARLPPEEAQLVVTRRNYERRTAKRLEIEAAEAFLSQRIEEHLAAFDKQREAENFSLWRDREDRRGNDELELHFDETTGELIRTLGDGNRQLGLSLGLMRESEIAAVAVGMDYFYGSGRHINELNARGENDENPDKQTIIELACEHQHEMARVRSKFPIFYQQLARHGHAVWRQQWGEKVGMQRDPASGRYLETVRHEGMMAEVWDSTAVWFSDYDKGAGEDQELVIWYSERTLSQLEEEEAVQGLPGAFVIDAATGAVIGGTEVTIGGRFFRLGELRREERATRGANSLGFAMRHNGFGPVENRPGKYSRSQKTQLHHRPVYGVLEAEGRIELFDGVVDGTITPAALEEWGINIGETRGLTRGQVGQRLSRIFWNIALTTTRRVLQWEPCPYEPWRNTAIIGQYVSNEGRLLGDSITKLTWGVNEQADVQFNEIYLNYLRRNNPNWLVNDAALVDEHGAKLPRALTRELIFGLNQIIHSTRQIGGNSQLSARDLVAAIMPEASPDDLQKLQFLIEKVEKRSLVTEIIKGQGPGTTAREAELSNNNSMRVGSSQAGQIGVRVVEQIDRVLLQDFATFFTASGDMKRPGEWEKYVTRIAGVRGLKCWYLMPTLDGLADQFRITHSASPMAQRHLTNAMIGEIVDRWLNAGAAMGSIRINVDHALKRQLELAGETNTRPWIVDGGEPLDPHMEIRALANGHFLKPHPQESVLSHFEAHVYQLAAIKPDWVLNFLDPMLLNLAKGLRHFIMTTGQQPPLGLESYNFDPEALAGPLLRHIVETQTFIYQQIHAMEQQQMAAQQAAMVGPGGQQGGPAGLPGPSGGPNVPDEQNLGKSMDQKTPALPLNPQARAAG
jgi:hypothetical protein